MATLSIYCNVTDLSFSLSPNFATPIQNPLSIPQGSQVLTDLYFVTPTGNPASPWNFLDPAAYVNPQIVIAQTNQAAPPFLADATAFTYHAGPPAYLEFLLDLSSASIATALGVSPALKAVFEVDWMNGTQQFVIQTDCRITRSVYFSGGSPPLPPNSIFATGTLAFSAAGSNSPTIASYVRLYTLDATSGAGTGAYTYDIALSATNRIAGDKFCLSLAMPASTNPTVNVKNQAGATIFTALGTGYAGTVQRWFTFGTDWTLDA